MPRLMIAGSAHRLRIRVLSEVQYSDPSIVASTLEQLITAPPRSTFSGFGTPQAMFRLLVTSFWAQFPNELSEDKRLLAAGGRFSLLG